MSRNSAVPRNNPHSSSKGQAQPHQQQQQKQHVSFDRDDPPIDRVGTTIHLVTTRPLPTPGTQTTQKNPLRPSTSNHSGTSSHSSTSTGRTSSSNSSRTATTAAMSSNSSKDKTTIMSKFWSSRSRSSGANSTSSSSSRPEDYSFLAELPPEAFLPLTPPSAPQQRKHIQQQMQAQQQPQVKHQQQQHHDKKPHHQATKSMPNPPIPAVGSATTSNDTRLLSSQPPLKGHATRHVKGSSNPLPTTPASPVPSSLKPKSPSASPHGSRHRRVNSGSNTSVMSSSAHTTTTHTSATTQKTASSTVSQRSGRSMPVDVDEVDRLVDLDECGCEPVDVDEDLPPTVPYAQASAIVVREPPPSSSSSSTTPLTPPSRKNSMGAQPRRKVAPESPTTPTSTSSRPTRLLASTAIAEYGPVDVDDFMPPQQKQQSRDGDLLHNNAASKPLLPWATHRAATGGEEEEDEDEEGVGSSLLVPYHTTSLAAVPASPLTRKYSRSSMGSSTMAGLETGDFLDDFDDDFERGLMGYEEGFEPVTDDFLLPYYPSCRYWINEDGFVAEKERDDDDDDDDDESDHGKNDSSPPPTPSPPPVPSRRGGPVLTRPSPITRR